MLCPNSLLIEPRPPACRRMLYHGPVDAVTPFFATLGFACPPRKEVPAFVQEVTSAAGQRQLAQPQLLARGHKQVGLTHRCRRRCRPRV